MLSRETLSKITEILISLAETERDVEITRQVLTENREYNSYQVFCYLDSDRKNCVDEIDIINFLQSKNIFVTETEAKLVILYYDQDLDKVLNYNEFLNLAESKSSQKKEKQREEGPLCFGIDYALTKLLEKEIIQARKILSLFNDVRGYSDFNIHDIFHAIKNNNNINFIYPENIMSFLNKNFASFIDQDINLIFNRLDLNKDNIIDLCEFHIFFGYPNCGYSCPFQKCENCGIQCCRSCRIDGPCYVHKFSSSNNENRNSGDENAMKRKVYRTYYTEFQNRENNVQNQNNDDPNLMISSNGFSTNRDNNEFNNGIQKISQGLSLRLSPKREYGPIEVCLSDIYNDNKNNTYNNNYNTYNKNLNNIIDDNIDYRTYNNYLDNIRNNNKNNNDNTNTIDQKFVTKDNINNNIIYQYNEDITNLKNPPKNSYNQNNLNNIKNYMRPNTNENNENINIINSYDNLKNNQIENKNNVKPKNKNEYEEDQFIDYLKEAKLLEKKIENLRIQLTLRSDFNWEQIFRIFELEGRGFLAKEDLIEGFNKFGIFPNDSDINLLLKRYDLKKEGIITYTDFFELIVPISKNHRMMVEKRKINSESDNMLANPKEFSPETLKCIKNLFVAIFNGEFILNKIKENFNNLKMNFGDIFKSMDPMGLGYVGEKELVEFLQKNGIFTSSNDCDLLFLRLNKLRNGKIDFKEMSDEIEGLN